MTAHLLLTPKQIQLIQTLKKNGSSSKLISRIFNDIYDQNIDLTWRQIRAIGKKTDKEIFGLQTNELMNFIDNQKGICIPKDDKIDKNKYERTALLTFTVEEMANLRQYGDVIFVDGTNFPNKLLW